MARPAAQYMADITAVLATLGFQRRRGQYARRVTEDIWEQVDFDAALKMSDGFWLIPEIGIAHRGAAEIYVRAYPDGYEGLPEPPILSELLRHVLPRSPKPGTPKGCLQERGYWVPRDHCPAEVIEKFSSELKEYGMPWMARFHTEADIERGLLDPEWEGPTGWEVHLPALMASQGRVKECLRTLDECLARARRERDGARWYRQYSNAVKKLVLGRNDPKVLQ